MVRLMLVILALGALFPPLAEAYDLLVLQARRDAAYEEVVRGFRSTLPLSQRSIVLADYVEVDVERIVREDRPQLVLAIGDVALAAARAVRQVPVVAVMSFGMRPDSAFAPNFTGIAMFAPPERYLALFRQMKVRRVGVVHAPPQTGWYLRQARQAAEKEGIDLIVREVRHPRETVAQLAALAGRVDALWMLPDTTSVNRETTEAFFRFGQEQSVPVVSFALRYLRLGAAAVVDIDRGELGRQAAEIAAAILSGERAAEIPVGYPRATSVKINPSVLKHLGPGLETLKKFSAATGER